MLSSLLLCHSFANWISQADETPQNKSWRVQPRQQPLSSCGPRRRGPPSVLLQVQTRVAQFVACQRRRGPLGNDGGDEARRERYCTHAGRRKHLPRLTSALSEQRHRSPRRRRRRQRRWSPIERRLGRRRPVRLFGGELVHGRRRVRPSVSEPTVACAAPPLASRGGEFP